MASRQFVDNLAVTPIQSYPLPAATESHGRQTHFFFSSASQFSTRVMAAFGWPGSRETMKRWPSAVTSKAPIWDRNRGVSNKVVTAPIAKLDPLPFTTAAVILLSA